MKSDWGFVVLVIFIVGVGCLGLALLEKHYIDDMKITCDTCIATCHPQTDQQVFDMCKVCYMAPINGEYLKYKNPTCKPIPPSRFEQKMEELNQTFKPQ